MSLMQFKEVALIGTDGNYVKFSPIVEGVEGASRTILVTENNEEIKIEDDQTVFTSVKNTITIVAPVLDADIATLNGWVTNDVSVGFAGYTIGGVGYAPAVTADDTSPAFQLELRANSTDDGSIIGMRGDVFQVSQIQRVSDIKHTWRIVLTQVCLQGKNATNGIRWGLRPTTNLYETTVDETFSTMATASTLPMYGGVFSAAGAAAAFSATGNAFRIALSGAATGTFSSLMFFPFSGVPMRLTVNGTQGAGFNLNANAIGFSAVNSTGGEILGVAITNSTTYTNATAGITTPTGTVYIKSNVAWEATGAATGSYTGFELRPNV